MLFPLAFLVLAATIPSDDLTRTGLENLAAGRLESARADLEKATRSNPGDPRAWLGLEEVYARLHQTKLASDAANRAIQLAHGVQNWQDQAKVRNYLGKVYLATGDFTQAIAEYREAIKVDPYDEAFRFDLAKALLEREQFREAIEVLEDARKVFDKSAQIELALGVAYYGQRRFADAAGAFLRTIELAPDVSQAYAFLGRMLDQAGDRMPEIKKRFAEYGLAHPQDYLGYLLQGKAESVGGEDLARAEALFRKSIELRSDLWESHYELGIVLESERNFTGAANEFEKSVQLNPDFPPTHYHLARVYDRLNRPQAADEQRMIHHELTSHEKVTAGMEPVR